jgi:hypothetical protein
MTRCSSVFIALLPVLGLAACQSAGEGETAGSQPAAAASLTGDEFAVVDAEDAFANIQDATLDHEMAMLPVFSQPETLAAGRRHIDYPGCHLGEILLQLDLDEDQRMAISEAVMRHRRVAYGLLFQLGEVNADLIVSANKQRQRIVDAYRAGDITREEAQRLLEELSRRTREAIRNNPANQRILKSLCDARLALLEEIRAVLDDAQREKWDVWVGGLTGRCFGG